MGAGRDPVGAVDERADARVVDGRDGPGGLARLRPASTTGEPGNVAQSKVWLGAAGWPLTATSIRLIPEPKSPAETASPREPRCQPGSVISPAANAIGGVRSSIVSLTERIQVRAWAVAAHPAGRSSRGSPRSGLGLRRRAALEALEAARRVLAGRDPADLVAGGVEKGEARLVAGIVAEPRLAAHPDDPRRRRRRPGDPPEVVRRGPGQGVDLQRARVLVLLAAERERVVAGVPALELCIRVGAVRAVALHDPVAAGARGVGCDREGDQDERDDDRDADQLDAERLKPESWASSVGSAAPAAALVPQARAAPGRPRSAPPAARSSAARTAAAGRPARSQPSANSAQNAPAGILVEHPGDQLELLGQRRDRPAALLRPAPASGRQGLRRRAGSSAPGEPRPAPTRPRYGKRARRSAPTRGSTALKVLPRRAALDPDGAAHRLDEALRHGEPEAARLVAGMQRLRRAGGPG